MGLPGRGGRGGGEGPGMVICILVDKTPVIFHIEVLRIFLLLGKINYFPDVTVYKSWNDALKRALSVTFEISISLILIFAINYRPLCCFSF